MTWDLNYSTAGINNSRRIYGLFFHDDFTGLRRHAHQATQDQWG